MSIDSNSFPLSACLFVVCTLRRAFGVGLVLGATMVIAADGGAGAAAAANATFKHGVNVSHWLSQNDEIRPYGAPWFDEEDVSWIAAHGYDHIRYAIDGRIWLRTDGTLDETKIAPFVQALRWTRERGLGAVLDMHFLPGASFDPGHEEAGVFSDLSVQARAADVWRRIARRFAGEGNYLRFEILNEPLAPENQQLNAFNARMLAAIRESNPTRVVYLSSNRYGQFTTVGDLVVPEDPHIAITVHYYEPVVFTHQRAKWMNFPADFPSIKFPGKVPDLAGILPPEHYSYPRSNTELTVAEIDAAVAEVAAWAATHAPGREIYLGEFGAYEAGPAESKRIYVAAVARAAERHGWGWAIWNYQADFAVRGSDGKPTAIHEGLFPK